MLIFAERVMFNIFVDLIITTNFLVDGAGYSTYNAESKLCECYESGVRECNYVMVEQDIGTVDC